MHCTVQYLCFFVNNLLYVTYCIKAGKENIFCLFNQFVSKETETMESDSDDLEHETEGTAPTHSEAFVAAESSNSV